jgi:hypothetical protein
MEARTCLCYYLDCDFVILRGFIPCFCRSGDHFFPPLLYLGCLYPFQDLLNVGQFVPYPSSLVPGLLILFCCTFCTMFLTRSTSSSMIVYSDIYLWALAFLRDPPICMIGHLGGHVSCIVVSNGVSCFIVSPLPCSSCMGALSFFHISSSFFGALPFFCCAVFGPGFSCCVGFLVTTLPSVDVLDDPTSTYFPLGMSLVMIGIFQSS